MLRANNLNAGALYVKGLCLFYQVCYGILLKIPIEKLNTSILRLRNNNFEASLGSTA